MVLARGRLRRTTAATLLTCAAGAALALGLAPGTVAAQTEPAPTAGDPTTPTVGAPPPPAAAMPPAPAPKPAPASPIAAPKGTAPSRGASPSAPAPPAVAPAPSPPPSAAARPPAPTPAPELAELKYFEGSWRCEGKAPAGPYGPEHGYRSTFKVKKDLGGFWYVVDYQQKKSKDHPVPVQGHGHVGYDSAAKRYVALGVDAVGGWVTESSPGWEGEKLVWLGEASVLGQKVALRETFTRKAPRQMVWVGEMKLGKDWTVLGTDTCKR